jgi:hypothetical protein
MEEETGMTTVVDVDFRNSLAAGAIAYRARAERAAAEAEALAAERAAYRHRRQLETKGCAALRALKGAASRCLELATVTEGKEEKDGVIKLKLAIDDMTADLDRLLRALGCIF